MWCWQRKSPEIGGYAIVCPDPKEAGLILLLESDGLVGWDRQRFGVLEGSKTDKMLGRCTGTFFFMRI